MKLIRIIAVLGCLLGVATGLHAAATCNASIAASTSSAEFTDHGNGTATHSRSGLMWKRCAEGQTWSASTCTGSASTMNWATALTSAVSATTGGYSDWRLPNIKELQSIIEERCYNPSINESIFPNMSDANFWSASANANGSDYAWDVDFYYGSAYSSSKYYSFQVRLVRTGQSLGAFDAMVEQTPPVRVDLPVDSTVAPIPGHKAVVMTHGWNSDVTAWPLEMANDLCTNNKIGVLVSTSNPAILDNRLSKMCQVRAPGNVLWDIWILDWRQKAATGLTNPMGAYVNAIDLGQTLATSLKGNNYSHIHLIAHSAGANLIDFATIWLKTWVKTEGRSPLEIHATFLDAYHPVRDSSVYGKQADWTDNYVDTRDVADLFYGLDGTKLFLENGHNINVTPLNDPCAYINPPSMSGVWRCRHNRPVRFYGLSVVPSFVGDASSAAADPITGTGAVGYPLSVENGRSLSSLNNAYPKGAKCVMDGGTCYPGSVPPSVWSYFPSALASTLVDTVTGSINYVAGVGTTLLNSLRMGAAGSQLALAGASSIQTLAQTASTTPTDAPSWIVVRPTTTQPTNTLRFNWRFAAAGEGFLRVYVDGNLVREIDQRHVSLASTTAEEVYIGGANGMLPAGTHRIAFRFDGFGSSASGVELTSVELGVTVFDDFPIGGALSSGWSQPAGSNAPWTVATDSTYAGTFSLKSGAITHSQKSDLSFTGNFSSGNVSFAGKVSSETNYDFLQLYVDGVLKGSWSGELGWGMVSFPITAGTHTLLWRYVKDNIVSAGSDAVWIDSVTLPGVLSVPGAPSIVSITPGPGRVTLILQAPGNTGGGAIVSYSATCSASGHPTVTASSTTATVVVPGLTPGVSYACTVTASNGSYTSAATAATPAIPKPKVDLTPILMLLLD